MIRGDHRRPRRLAAFLCGLMLCLVSGARAQDTAQDEERAYRVDAGDVLEILVPRYPEFSKPYLITRDGNLIFDLLGEVPVRGKSVAEIGTLLETRLSEYLRNPEGVSVRVVAKRMVVRVLGQVGTPGLTEVPKGANVQEVLAAAGGPKLGALLTEIVVRRKQGDWLEELPVDLKAYVEGRGSLPELRNDDEIFVPMVETDAVVERPLTPADVAQPSGRGKVQVLGAVALPGRYSLGREANLLSILTAAGGWTETADLTRIRRVPGGEGTAELLDLQAYLDRGGSLPTLEPGDVLSIPSRLLPTRSVKVLGAVVQPGPVQLAEDADLQTALVLAGGAQPFGDTRHIRLIRREGRELVRREIDLETYLRSGDPALLPDLQNGDVVFVPKGSVAVEAPTAMVYVFGQVAKPGPYPLVDQRPLLHALASAGGALPTADLNHVKIARGGKEAGQTFDLQAFQDGQGGELPELQDGDVVTIEPNTVTVVGAVATPGPVEVRMKASVVEAVAAAGGPSETADLRRVVLRRRVGDQLTKQVVDLEQYLYEPETAPPMPLVQGGDVVAVEQGTVDRKMAYVLGSVLRPGVIMLPGQEASLMYCLAQAGGVLPTGDAQHVRIVRNGGAALTSQVFDLQALQSGQSTVAPPNVRPGDVVTVQDLNQSGTGILVLGAVARQGRYPVQPGQTVTDIVGLAGGLLPNAIPSRTRLVRKSGEVETLDLAQFSIAGQRMPEVHDGDTLVIAQEKATRDIWEEVLRIFPFMSFFLR